MSRIPGGLSSSKLTMVTTGQPIRGIILQATPVLPTQFLGPITTQYHLQVDRRSMLNKHMFMFHSTPTLPWWHAYPDSQTQVVMIHHHLLLDIPMFSN